MRRDRIVKAVNNLKDALHAAQIRELLRIARNGQQGEGISRTQRILIAYNTFTQHYKEFSDDEKQLMSFFGLDPLLDVAFWSNLIEGEQAVSRKLLSEVDVGAYNIIFVMPKLRDLLTRENDRDALCIADAAGVEHEMKRLKIFVAEKERALTDPSVIINIVRSMNELYDALSSLYGANGVSLAVGAIDSGGGKSFDFFGAVHVMEALDDLFISVWNRIKLSGEENIRYLIEMAMMASGFMAKIKEAQIGQIVSEDQAQRLTRLVAKAVETLFRNGAYTETMDEVRVIRASEFLTPKTQLLEYKQEARVEPKREDARDYADPLAGSSGAGLFASPVLGAASALNGGGYSDGGLGGSGLGGSGLGGSGLGGSSLGDSSLGGSGLNGGGLNGSAGGLYGASAYGASASPTPARSNGPAAEPLYRPQPTVLRDFREQRDPVKDLKDILEAS